MSKGRGSFRKGLLKKLDGVNYYTFDDDESTELTSDDILEMSRIRPRGDALQAERQIGKPRDQLQTFLEKQIVEGDTLRTLSLQYGCPVGELKRINNLMSDTEFHALKFIKIPVKQHGLLQEQHAQTQQLVDLTDRNSLATFEGNTSEPRRRSVSGSDVPLSSEDETEHYVRTISIRDMVNGQSSDAQKFLHDMDRDLARIRDSASSSCKNSLDEVTQTLTCKRFYPLHRPQKLFSGIDCGISWWGIVGMLLGVVVLLPIFIVVYYELTKNTDSSSIDTPPTPT